MAIYLLRDLDKVDELMADITEQQELAKQISDAISRPVGFGDDVNEVIVSEGSRSLRESMRPAKSNAQENHVASLGGTPKVVCFWRQKFPFSILTSLIPYLG